MLVGGAIEVGVDDPRLDGGGQVGGVDLEDRVHLREDHYQRAVDRDGAARQARSGAAGHDGRARRGARRTICCTSAVVAWKATRKRLAGVQEGGLVKAIAFELIGRGDDAQARAFAD